jgi:hypothetical protein
MIFRQRSGLRPGRPWPRLAHLCARGVLLNVTFEARSRRGRAMRLGSQQWAAVAEPGAAPARRARRDRDRLPSVVAAMYVPIAA